MYEARPIGGYYELAEPFSQTRELHQNSLKFVSCRVAFLALLKSLRPSCIYVPRYICDSMLEPFKAIDVEVKFYSLNADFSLQSLPLELEENCYLVYVNYFGLQDSYVRVLANSGLRSHLIVDNSQSLYSEPTDCIATIYSPRKFFGLPDGGLLYSSSSVKEPLQEDEGSIGRLAHLVYRKFGMVFDGYQHFQRAEDSLKDLNVSRMSGLTREMLKKLDYRTAAKVRKTNFLALYSSFQKYNELQFKDDLVVPPLCYPFLNRKINSQVKSLLASKKIYLPTYWPEVLQREGINSFERGLVENCLFLVCDQRFSLDDMEYQIAMVKEVLGL